MAAFDIQNLTQFEFGAIVLTVFIAGLVFGCLIAWGLLNRKAKPKAVAAEKAEQALADYKTQVDQHFEQTSKMFENVTMQYKELYDHIAQGAIDLCDDNNIKAPKIELTNPDMTEKSQETHKQ